MKKWYLFYSNDADAEKLQRLVGELQASINQERIKLQRPVGEIVKQPGAHKGQAPMRHSHSSRV
jgi:hypothetical protein